MDTKNKRIVGLFAAIGFTLPVLLVCVGEFLHTYGLGDSSGVRFSARFVRYLWPTVIYMMHTGGLNFQTLGALLYSAMLNGLIYGFIGHGAYTVWKLVAGPKDDGWWPSKPDK